MTIVLSNLCVDIKTIVFFGKKSTPRTDITNEPRIIAGIAHDEFSIEFGTFIPKILAINVGIINIIDIRVNCFITTFRLLEITEAKASIIPL